ncbi:MAG: exodeoxyribonuclease VII large subunit [Hyphomonadaceae bacterium]|jgi:exodeoxyribonuclease VII large subunit|nr:exodeoxyribonuclease VII large subunit [Hyphomonadaceae bacterium]
MPFPSEPDDAPVPGARNAPEYSVSEVSGAIKRTLEDRFGLIRVRGELGRVTRAASGHLYADLKDAGAVLSGVMWKGSAARLSFRPEEGMEVIATGRVSTFAGTSKYQMIMERLEPAGVGALLAQLEDRRKRLLAEGLFDEARKRALPYLPAVIGVVTSPTGAVIRDILHRLGERFPVHVLVWPVLVQGEKAATQVSAAITGFNALAPGGPVPRPDLLIVARGGGSIEDLWAFNEEVVVRAAAASTIPLISAVGHETDTTLIDFASDLRAPTPTAAAEKAVPVRLELLAWLDELAGRQTRSLLGRLESGSLRLGALTSRLPRADSLLAPPRQRLDLAELRLAPALRSAVSLRQTRLAAVSGRLRPDVLATTQARAAERLAGLDQRRMTAFAGLLRVEAGQAEARRETLTRLDQRLAEAMRQAMARRTDRLAGQFALLQAVSHTATLARGYAIVRDANGGLVRDVAGARAARKLAISFADGIVPVVTGDGRPVQASLFE